MFVPSALMGGTLPALVAARGANAGAAVSLLYGTNTLGAVAGALLAGFVLLERLGTRATIGVAGLTSLVVGALALRLAGRPDVAARPVSPPPAAGSKALFAAASVAGFAALLAQGAWSRALAQFFENSVYSFAAVLAVFLAGIGFGSLAAGPIVRRARAPARLFGVAQSWEALLVLGSVVLLAMRDDPSTHARLHDALARGLGPRLAAEVGFAATVVLAPTFLSGASLPFAVAALGGEGGAATGRLYAANTAGSVAGALVAGFLLLPAVGVARTLEVAAAASIAAALLASPRARSVVLPAALAAAALPAVVFAGPSLRFWRAAESEVRVVAHAEDEVASASVVEDGQGRRRLKLNNTYSLGGADGVFQERRQGILPLLLHPDARSLLWIGLGTGNSLGAASRFPLERIEAVELVPSVPRLAKHFGATNFAVLSDPRVRVRVGDGRAFLRRTDERFDAIVVDLLLPWEAGAGFLMTREFHESAARALAPDGVFVQWLPLHQMRPSEWTAVVATARTVFPDGSLWIGYPQGTAPIVAFAGRLGPPGDPGERVRRALRPEILRAAGEAGWLDFGDAMGLLVASGNALDAGIRGAAILRDDRCPIEFEAPWSGPERARLPAVNLDFVRGLREAEPPPAGAEGAWRASGRILAGHALLLRALVEGRAPRPEDREAELREYAAALREAPTSPYANAVCVAALKDAIASAALPAPRVVLLAAAMTEANPQQSLLHYLAGIAREQAGDAPAAESSFEAALALEPTSTLAKLHLGYLRFDRGALAEAKGLLESALEDRALPPYHRAKGAGALAAAAGDAPRARAELERALGAVPGDGQARRWIERLPRDPR